MIRFRCPRCASVIDAKDRAAGKQRKCPGCGCTIKVPAAPLVEAARSSRPNPPPAPPVAPSRRGQSVAGAMGRRGRYAIAAVAAAMLVALGWWLWPRTMDRQAVVAMAEPATAHIKGPMGHGTGFMVAPGTLVTNRHVVANELNSQLKVFFPSEEKSTPIAAKVVYESRDVDLAILELDRTEPFLRLASRHRFSKGESITVIGNPGLGADATLENAVSSGVLSTTAKIGGATYYQLDISINPGNSGGPVLNGSGYVIGVVTLRAPDKEGLGFCVPLEQLSEALDAAGTLTEDAKERNAAMHDLRAATFMITGVGALYRVAMGEYIDTLTSHLQKGSTIEAGLAEARQTVSGPLAALTTGAVEVLEPEVSRLSVDPNINESLREKLVAAWTTCKQLKSYLDAPRGSLPDYRKKFHALSDRHTELTTSLKLLAGVQD